MTLARATEVKIYRLSLYDSVVVVYISVVLIRHIRLILLCGALNLLRQILNWQFIASGGIIVDVTPPRMGWVGGLAYE